MAIGGAALVALLLTACTAPAPDESPTPADATTPTPDAGGSTADPAEVAAIQAAVETTMEENNVRAAIVRVMRGDEVVLTQAWGESMAQVPATTDMHFRSGAVSIPMVSTVLLQLVDEGTVALDDKLSEWMPDVPNADKVTLEQLSQMTSGYADYVQDPTFLEDFNREPASASGLRRSSIRSAPASRSSSSRAPTGAMRTRTTCCSPWRSRRSPGSR